MLPKGPLAKLAANPNATSIYNRSKALERHIIKQPEWDVAPDTITMKAIQQDRIHDEVLQKQEQMRSEAKEKAKQNKKRIEEVRKMQEDLRQQFIKANNFICECERKEAIVTQKIAEKEEQIAKIQKEYDELKEKYETMRDYHDNELIPTLNELQVYEDMLEEVVKESDLFEDKEDFIDRCKALFLAQSEVAENDEKNLKLIEDIQADIVKTANEIAIMQAGFDNQLIELQKKQEKEKAEMLKWENVLPPAKKIITGEEKDTFMMMDQVQQLYLLFCKRNNIEPEFKREQVEEQLDFIKTEIEIMCDIIEMSKEIMELENRSDIAEHGSGKVEYRENKSQHSIHFIRYILFEFLLYTICWSKTYVFQRMGEHPTNE